MAFSDCHLRTAMPYFRSVLEDPNGTFREFNVWCTSRQSLSILLPLIGGATMVRTPFKACGDRDGGGRNLIAQSITGIGHLRQRI